ncbi:MAG: DUF1330 domain-containing protein [Actinobacteria bacterium]|nr:DUF1330 domain-containing protein [Actinomycetota bacterium]
MTAHHYPTDEVLGALAASTDDTPVVMVNLNRYRDRAEYPADTPEAGLGLSGREAYLRYGIVAHAAITSVGGRILWAADANEVVIGCEHDRYDEIIAVWYPNRAAFLTLAAHPGYPESHVHRDAGVEQAMLLAVDAEAEPVLRNPFDPV